MNAGSDIGFTITVTNSGVADATAVTISDSLPGGTGATPVHWTENPDNPDCTISGSDGSQLLSWGRFAVTDELDREVSSVANPIGFITESFGGESALWLVWSLGLIGLTVAGLVAMVKRFRAGSQLERRWRSQSCDIASLS